MTSPPVKTSGKLSNMLFGTDLMKRPFLSKNDSLSMEPTMTPVSDVKQLMYLDTYPGPSPALAKRIYSCSLMGIYTFMGLSVDTVVSSGPPGLPTNSPNWALAMPAMPSMGEVIAAGPGKTDDNGKLVPMGVKVGDKILFGKYSGQEFKMEGADLLHMREDDVIGVIA